jgi:hypothetical protein
MENQIKVTYIINNDSQTDMEYETQQEREFIINKHIIIAIIDLLDKNHELHDTIEIMKIELIDKNKNK